MLLALGTKRKKSALKKSRTKFIFSHLACVGVLLYCCMTQAVGQLTARNADGKATTLYTNGYGNRDTIFVFNQIPQAKTGNLSLQQPGLNTYKWHRFNYNTKNFESFFTTTNVATTSQDNLAQGGYKVTVTPQGATVPRDSFVVWIYLNPGFSFNLHKDDHGEVIYNYKFCGYTNFRLNPNTEQSSFSYYNPGNLQQALTLDNRITFSMKPGNGFEVVTSLSTQGSTQYLRDNSPPYEDMRYYFRANDMFGIEQKDEIMYRTIIPYATISAPVLPESDPTSAPVPVKFTYKPYNATIYEWHFGDGDSIVYNLENLPPDTIKHTYYTPKKSGYQVVLTVTSMNGCVYTADPVRITVDDPLLEAPNVFTPNGDTTNDYFKPHAVSLRKFEITIFTRTGQRVYRYRGDDLRDWLGWDGRIENTGKEAAEGVYFYVIKAIGWDEPPTQFNEKSKKQNPSQGSYGGSFHLYR